MSPRVDEAMTPGLRKALEGNKHLEPCECGFPMPKYPGRYPSKCPVCGASRSKDDGDGASASSADIPR